VFKYIIIGDEEEDLEIFLKLKKEKKEEPLATQIIETMPKKNGRPIKGELDDGKIKALREAGWSVAKIADEFGCVEQTIYNHLKDMGLPAKKK
jgi:DNA invertase Pin-like site-specific DNA recombinase